VPLVDPHGIEGAKPWKVKPFTLTVKATDRAGNVNKSTKKLKIARSKR